MFDLFKEIKNHLPYDYNEAESKRKFLNFLLEHSDCYSRKNFYGHVTAGGFVCDGKGNILLNHHKASGMWFQFGGHSDENTNSLEVATREIREEAGIEDLILVENKIFDVDVQKILARPQKNEPEHYHFDVNFMFLVKNKDFKISNESTEIRWVTIDEARKLVNPSYHAMLRMIDKYEQYLNNNIFCSAK